MKKLIFVNYQNDNDIKSYLDSMLFINSFSYNEFKNNMDSNIHIYSELVFEIKGKDYNEKKRCLEDIAQDFYIMLQDSSISQGELLTLQSWLESKAKLFGLVKEFKENALI